MKIQLEINQENGNNTLPYGLCTVYSIYRIGQWAYKSEQLISLILKLSLFRMTLLYLEMK
jgi:hypothetical protein